MTVTQLDAPCWIVKGTYAERPHFHERKDAIDVVGEYGAFARVEREDEPCWVAKCSVCGEIFQTGDYDYDELHLRTRAEAEAYEEAHDDHCDDEPTATELAVADLNSDPR